MAEAVDVDQHPAARREVEDMRRAGRIVDLGAAAGEMLCRPWGNSTSAPFLYDDRLKTISMVEGFDPRGDGHR
jgi:hypothetical protein